MSASTRRIGWIGACTTENGNGWWGDIARIHIYTKYYMEDVFVCEFGYGSYSNGRHVHRKPLSSSPSSSLNYTYTQKLCKANSCARILLFCILLICWVCGNKISSLIRSFSLQSVNLVICMTVLCDWFCSFPHFHSQFCENGSDAFLNSLNLRTGWLGFMDSFFPFV